MVLSVGGSFTYFARNARCTAATDLFVWYSNTQNDFSPGAAIFSLHTLASPNGKNVIYDEKQITEKKKSFSFYLYRFRKYVSYGLPVINFCNPGAHYEMPYISVMELGHLLTPSGLMYPEASSKAYHDSFRHLGSSVSLPRVIYFEAFYLYVVFSFPFIPVIFPKLVLFLTPLQFMLFFFNLSKCILLFSCISSVLLLFFLCLFYILKLYLSVFTAKIKTFTNMALKTTT